MRRFTTLLLVLALLLAPQSVAASHDPHFSTTVPEPVLVPGETQQLTIQLSNEADDPDVSAETAHDVEVTVSGGDSPIDVRSGPRTLGTMRDGDTRSVSVAVDVPATIDAGTYALPVEVSYVNDGERKTATVNATVRIKDRAFFRVENTSSSVAVGGTGTVSVTLTNVGSQSAHAAAVTLSSTSSDVRFGRSAAASRFVGDWAPGETRTLTYEVTVADSAEPLPYTLEARVVYENAEGDTRQSRPLRVGLEPLPEPDVRVRDVTADLRVGDDGEVTATVVNRGDRPIEGVVVDLSTALSTVDVGDASVALGTLEPGDTATVTFDVSVSEAASAGPRQFDVLVSYRDDAGERRQLDPLEIRVAIGEEQPTFAVEPADASLRAGSSGTLRVTITNRESQRLSDVSVKLYANDPISADDDEAFVASLKPGESVTLVFGVSVAGDALEKSYPVKFDVRYDDADGDTHVSDTYQVPVQVTSSGGGGLPVSPLVAVGAGVLAVVLLGVAAVLLRR